MLREFREEGVSANRHRFASNRSYSPYLVCEINLVIFVPLMPCTCESYLGTVVIKYIQIDVVLLYLASFDKTAQHDREVTHSGREAEKGTHQTGHKAKLLQCPSHDSFVQVYVPYPLRT